MSNLDRRLFLAGGIGTAGLGLVPASALAGSRWADPPVSAWQALDAQMAGSVLLPSDSAYAKAKQLYNPRWDSQRPVAVVRPANRGDVAKAMAFADRYALTVAPRSGGHCYLGSSTGTGVMVLDVRALKSVTLNGSRTQATIGAGAGLYNVHVALNRGQRTIPTGTCPTVGAAGLTLGGGLGPEGRAYGTTSDRLVSATCVLVDGDIVTASASQNADLFWSLRGGGGAQGAVVTDLVYRTHATSNLGQFSVSYPVSAAQEVILAWAQFCADAPRTTKVNLAINSNSTKTAFTVRMHGVTAPGAEAGQLKALTDLIGVRPLNSSHKVDTYMNTVLEIANGDPTPPRRDFTAGSDVIKTMTAAAAQAIIAAASEGIRRRVGFQSLIGPLTGAIQDPSATASAFPYRSHAALIQWFCPLPTNNQTAYNNARGWIGFAHNRLGALSAGGFINYVEPGRPASKYFGPNLTRLRTVKQHYDPADRLNGSVSY